MAAPPNTPYSLSRATFSTDPPTERETLKKKWKMVQETRSQKSPPPPQPPQSAEKEKEKVQTAKEASQKSQSKKKVDSKTKSSTSSNKRSQKKKRSSASKRKDPSKRRDSSQKPIASKENEAGPVEENEKRNWKKKAAEGFQLHKVAVIVSLILQLGLTFYIMSELIKASGPVLLFLVGAMVGLLPSLFFTVKVIFSRSKIWLLLGGLDAVLLMGLALTVLIIQTQKDYSKMEEKEEQETKFIQRLSAVTIIVMVCHVLAIGNHFYYTKWGSKKDADEEEGHRHAKKKESKRTTVGTEAPRPNSRQMTYMVEAGQI